MGGGDAAWTAVATRMAEIVDLEAVAGLLYWDGQTLCPPRGRAPRRHVSSALAGLVHARLTDPAFGEAIEAASDSRAHGRRAAALAALRRERRLAARQPPDLVRALADAGAEGNRAWEAARHARDFALFAPALRRIVALKVEQADALADGRRRYDALLDLFEPGMTLARLWPLLAELRDGLVPLAAPLLDGPAADGSLVDHGYPAHAQLELARRIAADLGFDGGAGRIDLSTHPFCGGPGPTDVRVTTRIHDSLEPGCVFSTMHEVGHALLEQGIDPALHRTVLARAPSLGVHESQALLWENVIGRSPAFWRRYLPVAAEAFPGRLGGVPLDRFLRAINRVVATPVRVDADEVTYHLHILVRVELELALIDGGLDVRDLPDAWNERMGALLGRRPAHDAEGVLQDIHWSRGKFGYFPTYTLGAVYAASLGEALRAACPLDALVEAGRFDVVLGWLRAHVHRRGAEAPAEELMEQATGARLSPAPLLRHLRRRYGDG
jgi:carboxypeptidase Taq